MENLGKILMVENDELLLKTCYRILSSEGYDVDMAMNETEAVKKSENENFDVVITDLKISDTDALTVVKQIKAIKPQTHFAVLADSSDISIKAEIEKLGITHYLFKPFLPHKLSEIILNILNKNNKNTKTEEEMSSKKFELEPNVVFDGEIIQKVNHIITSNKGKPGILIPVLQQVQEICGYLPHSLQKMIAKGLNLPESEVHSVVTFYAFFTQVPRGRYNIRVCLGTACYVKAGQKIIGNIKNLLGIDVGGITSDMKFSLEAVRCLGACGLAPALIVGNIVHGRVEPNKVDEILSAYQ